jgi:hypothetical protein
LKLTQGEFAAKLGGIFAKSPLSGTKWATRRQQDEDVESLLVKDEPP